MTRIAHLVEANAPGSITRYLDFLSASPEMGFGRHETVPVPQGRLGGVHVEADVIVSHLPIGWRGLPGLIALRARYSGTPMIHVEHTYSEGFVAANAPAKRRFTTLLASAYSLFDRVVAVSEAQGKWLLRRGVVTQDRLVVIPPCVDLAPFRALRAPKTPARVFGALGRFHSQKGFDLLIRAFRQVNDPELRLRIYGNGPERTALEALSEGDARIEIRGFVTNPATALSDVDAIAMPSRWEPFGLVALEARAAGRTVIASNVDGLSDQAFEGVLPVPSPTPEAWAAAIRTVARLTFDQNRGTGHEARTAAKWTAVIAEVRGIRQVARVA